VSKGRRLIEKLKKQGFMPLARKAWRAFRRGGVDELKRSYRGHRARAPKIALHLSPDRSVDEPAWRAYLKRIYRNQLIEPLKNAETAAPRATLWVCIPMEPAHGENARLFAKTRETLTKLQRASKYPVRAVLLGNPEDEHLDTSDDSSGRLRISGIEQLSTMIAPEDLVLFIRIGDEIRTELHLALMLFGCFNAEFSLIDLYFRENRRIYPILLHGVDSLHGINCDYFHSRFCLRGDALLMLTQKQAYDTPRDLAVAYLSSTLDDRYGRRMVHVALPLICANLNRDYIDNMRRIQIRWQHECGTEAVGDPGESPAPIPAARKPPQEATVSVVICTKDNAQLLQPLVRMLLQEPIVHEIVIVSNNTTNEYALVLLECLVNHEHVKVLRYDKAFNFSAQCNLGVKNTTGECVLFLNDDICPVTDDWLEVMVRAVRENPRCIVGPLLLYPDQTVQHGGMFLGFNGVAGHTLRHARLPDDDFNLMLLAPRRVSCLTGAVMLMTRKHFDDLNGFDPLLATSLQDVDLSLRATNSGAFLIFEPRAVLFHMESVSLRTDLVDKHIRRCRENEHHYFNKRWGDEIRKDRWMNPLLDPSDETLLTLR
jgi:GT2 family glycosyltransferase